MTSIDAPVSDAPDITPGVRHATDKAATRIAEGMPIPGALEDTIRVRLDVGVTTQGGVVRQVLPDGTVNLLRPDTGAVVDTSNILNDFTRRISNNPLTRVTLVNPDTGSVIAAYQRVAAPGFAKMRHLC